MIMAVLNVDVSTDNLLEAVSRLPDKEFERFVEKAKKLRQKSDNSLWSKSEIEIIKNINKCVFPAEKQARFDELIEKRQDEVITKSELAELTELAEESEELTVRRVDEGTVKIRSFLFSVGEHPPK
jgi:hypothetical protein